jgi:DDE superfamily endonuclease
MTLVASMRCGRSQIFLSALAKKFSRSHILLIVDGAGNHKSRELAIPTNVTLARLPAHSPDLNPQENIWDEIREKIFKNYAAKSMDEVCEMLVEGSPLYRTQPRAGQIHDIVPIYCKFNLIWSWYQPRARKAHQRPPFAKAFLYPKILTLYSPNEFTLFNPREKNSCERC